jgi:hypothetical protein
MENKNHTNIFFDWAKRKYNATCRQSHSPSHDVEEREGGERKRRLFREATVTCSRI